MKKTLGLMFGTFSPVHLGHLKVAKEIKENFNFDYLRLIPSGNVILEGYKNNKLSFETREQILKEVMKELRKEEIHFDPIEENAGFTTYQTCKIFESKGFEVFPIIGSDTLPKFLEWKDGLKLLENFKVITIDRGNLTEEELKKVEFKNIFLFKPTLYDVSSTVLREKIKNDEELTGLIPEGFEKIYRSLKCKL